MEKQIKHLTVEHPLVDELASKNHPWWDKLVKLSHEDKDINIQVRGNYLSVYCKMGNLLRICLQGTEVVCKVHYKYLIGAHSPEYVDALPSGDDIAVSQPTRNLFVSSILEEENFLRVKQNIARYAGEEKQIQSRLVACNRDTLLDAEIAFFDSGDLADSEDATTKLKGGNTRIDLANYDKNRKALVFVELKQIFDQRLYSDEINKQVAKYVAFAHNYKGQLASTYNDVIRVKKRLNIIDNSSLASVEIHDVEPKPILAIAGYNQTVIDAMKEKILKGPLNTSNLAGLYFFGTEVDLNLKSDKNKEVFI